MWQKSNKLLL